MKTRNMPSNELDPALAELSNEESLTGPRARILVIEDNPTNLELMTYLLQAFGHEAVPARDGEEALEIVQREPFDLIICDLQMPRLDGYEFARHLKSDPARQATPLIAVTALAMVGDRDKVLAAGFDGYIAKPINPETFVQQTEQFLQVGTRSSPTLVAAGIVEALPASPGGPTILVVDDSPVNIHLAQSLLEPSGYRVVAANTVLEGLRMAQEIRPALILCDLHLRGEWGFALLERVKADPELEPIPFILISSTSTNQKHQQRGIERGADLFILRPIDPQALLKEIQEELKDA